MGQTWTKSTGVAPSSGSYQGFSGQVQDTGNTVNNLTFQLQFAANTNAASGNFALNFNAATVQAIFFVATQNCTITTNNSTSPTNTINLIAGAPLYWSRSEGYYANPINANTNAGFLACNSATTLTYGILTN